MEEREEVEEHASWLRLQIYFQLPGRVHWGTDCVTVELKPESVRALHRDLQAVCTKVAQAQPHVPDGRRLFFRVQGTNLPRLDAQEQAEA